MSDRSGVNGCGGGILAAVAGSILPPGTAGKMPAAPTKPLVLLRGLRHNRRMSEIVQFVHRGAAQITPRIVRGVHKKLPFLKMSFTQIQAPNYPHLIEQLEFLANVVEDFAEGAEDDLPYITAAGAVFALIYAHRQKDLIPDFVPEYGHADESAVVRAVLIEHEKVLAGYAGRHQLNWPKLTVNP
jgi:uncharacterized membrane protein YkvA (DUF1232 family)